MEIVLVIGRGVPSHSSPNLVQLCASAARRPHSAKRQFDAVGRAPSHRYRASTVARFYFITMPLTDAYAAIRLIDELILARTNREVAGAGARLRRALPDLL